MTTDNRIDFAEKDGQYICSLNGQERYSISPMPHPGFQSNVMFYVVSKLGQAATFGQRMTLGDAQLTVTSLLTLEQCLDGVYKTLEPLMQSPVVNQNDLANQLMAIGASPGLAYDLSMLINSVVHPNQYRAPYGQQPNPYRAPYGAPPYTPPTHYPMQQAQVEQLRQLHIRPRDGRYLG